MKFRFSFPVRWVLLSAAIFLLIGPGRLMADVTHTVRPGESLYSIGKKYRVAAAEIAKANPLSGERIRPGQNLTIPGAKSRESAKNASPAEAQEPGDLKVPGTHKVKKGETFASIAKKYGLEVEDLKKINEAQGSELKAGQTVRLRLEEEEEDSGAVKNDAKQETAEAREESPVLIRGNGFLLGEKSRELLGRVARSFQGFRYTKGGGSINGMDCSSYVQQVYKVFGIDLPRTAREQFRIGYAVAKNTLQVGDLVFFKRAKSREPTHVGIYLGENKYIHTSLTKRQVEIDSLDGRYANLHFMGAKRIEEVEIKELKPDPEGE